MEKQDLPGGFIYAEQFRLLKKKGLDNMLKRLNKINDILFILISVLVCFLIEFIFLSVADLLGFNIITSTEIYGESIETFSIFNFILLTFLGPLFETLLLALLVKYTKKIIKNDYIICTFVALIFGALHYYSVLYMMVMACIGFIFLYAYLLFLNKKVSSFNIMFLIHSIFNGIAYLMNTFL